MDTDFQKLFDETEQHLADKARIKLQNPQYHKQKPVELNLQKYYTETADYDPKFFYNFKRHTVRH